VLSASALAIAETERRPSASLKTMAAVALRQWAFRLDRS
jgi:hypothetical protein